MKPGGPARWRKPGGLRGDGLRGGADPRAGSGRCPFDGSLFSAGRMPALTGSKKRCRLPESPSKYGEPLSLRARRTGGPWLACVLRSRPGSRRPCVSWQSLRDGSKDRPSASASRRPWSGRPSASVDLAAELVDGGGRSRAWWELEIPSGPDGKAAASTCSLTTPPKASSSKPSSSLARGEELSRP